MIQISRSRRYPGSCARITASLAAVLVACGGREARAADAAEAQVEARFENRLYVPQPGPIDGMLAVQSPAVTFYSGYVGLTGTAATPNNGSLWLVHSALGLPIAGSMASTVYCLDDDPYYFWVLEHFLGGQLWDPGRGR
jgi:hypothetical protein